MRKQLIGLAILFITSTVFAGNISLIVSNYTNMSGTLVLGNPPTQIGPIIGSNQANVRWSPPLNGKQPIGLKVGSTNNICYLNNGAVILNPSLYKGGDITIDLAQQQFPSGIACGCTGIGCDVG